MTDDDKEPPLYSAAWFTWVEGRYLGTDHDETPAPQPRAPDRSFESFRGDVGAEFSLSNLHAGDWSTVPYAGVYADYWWNDDSESLNDTVGILDNWSARVTGGIDFTSPGENASFTIGGELGGLGDTTTWSAKAEARFAF